MENVPGQHETLVSTLQKKADLIISKLKCVLLELKVGPFFQSKGVAMTPLWIHH